LGANTSFKIVGYEKNELLKVMFANLFYHMAYKIQKRKGYKIYVQNFGIIYSVFIIKSLAIDGYDLI
jgi:hypothetical protein